MAYRQLPLSANDLSFGDIYVGILTAPYLLIQTFLPNEPTTETTMNKILTLTVIISSLFMTSCDSKTDANGKNFEIAITQYLDKNELCLDEHKWPVDVGVALEPGVTTEQMLALEAGGLAKSAQIQIEYKDRDGFDAPKMVTVKRYTLSESAKPFMREREVQTEKKIKLCWGKQALDKLVKWDGPMKSGDYQQAMLYYTHKVENVAEWAKKPGVHAAYPRIKLEIDNAGKHEKRRAVKLSSAGWEALD